MKRGVDYEELFDLAALHATEGLDDGEGSRLFSGEDGAQLASDLEVAAAAVQIALARSSTVPIGLEERLLAGSPLGHASPLGQAHAVPARSFAPPDARPLGAQRAAPRAVWPPLVTLGGWAVAAASLALCVVLGGRLARLQERTGVVDPTLGRDRLVAEAADAFQIEWLDDFRDPQRSAELEGTVVWSDQRNEGYMTFAGLAGNDPAQAQYQLWIFRGTDLGAEPYPVDGGVFDVPAEGTAVVPIDPKLRLERAATFVVTLEPPGGVVVSDRSQIVAAAQRSI